MIDLSFLTDEEQETILAVLKRDADLKKAEEERIKNLQRAVKDKGLLKYLTGEWFYETKLLRHQDRIHGSDIIKASMRSRQKPLTILELSQILPEKQSFVSSDNQDVYIPPELCGLIQACTEPRERGQSLSPCEIPQVIPKPMVQSPTKQRWNPFNSERPPTHAPKGERGQVGVEPMEAEQAPSEEPSPSFDFTMSKGECHEESPGGASESIALPMPITTRVVDTSQDSLIDAEGSPGGHTNSAAPRGILKHMPNSSSTDSLSSRLAPQEATGLDSPVKTDNAKESLDWLDRKQVRFSAAGRSGEQWQDGKELGEHGLLDVDSVNATEEENNNDFAKIKDTVVGLCEPLPTPRDLDIGEDGLSCESGINDQKQNDGPHQSPGDLCEQDHDESLSPQGSKLHSAQQESGHDDASIPLRSTLKQRLMPSSKSLENLVSHAKEEKNKDSSNSSRGQLNLSVDDVSSSPTSSGPSYLEQMKNMSASVPALQEQEMDSDSPSESNMSLSSGMASMSSVSGSVSSIYNADFGDIEVQGTIQLAVNYVQKLGEFQIFVVQCRDLAVADPKKNRSDPYVKCYLLPDKTKLGKRKTSIKKKTLNPSYSEVLRFKILMEVLKTQKLNISVWHNDTFRRNSFLGEVDLDLSDWDYNNTQIIDHALKPRVSEQKSTLSASLSQLIENRGEMRIALRFLLQMSHSKRTSTTATGEVQIWVKDCKNLPPVRGVIIDPFVKCTVLPDTSKRSRQKTRVVKRTANPMFNHTMVYNGFRPEDLREACAEITIWDHDRLSNHYIGGLRLGLGTGKSYGAEVAWMDSTTPEAKLWERMMQSNGEWVEDILPLRMFAIAKSMSK